MISIIIPAKNEGNRITRCLENIKDLDSESDIIIVDSGGNDPIVSSEKSHIRVLKSDHSGRGSALQLGAQFAKGTVLLFLHADTQLPNNALQLIKETLEKRGVVGGWFTRKLDDPRLRYRFIDMCANLFSCLAHIATGDQALFCQKKYFDQIKELENYPIFEDMTLCKKLKIFGKLKCINTPILVSPRRFYRQGIFNTITTNLILTFKYFIGIDAKVLYREYYIEKK